jgi:hypothetical protein
MKTGSFEIGGYDAEDPRFDFSDYNPRTRQLHEITIRTFYGFRVVLV